MVQLQRAEEFSVTLWCSVTVARGTSHLVRNSYVTTSDPNMGYMEEELSWPIVRSGVFGLRPGTGKKVADGMRFV